MIGLILSVCITVCVGWRCSILALSQRGIRQKVGFIWILHYTVRVVNLVICFPKQLLLYIVVFVLTFVCPLYIGIFVTTGRRLKIFEFCCTFILATGYSLRAPREVYQKRMLNFQYALPIHFTRRAHYNSAEPDNSLAVATTLQDGNNSRMAMH